MVPHLVSLLRCLPDIKNGPAAQLGCFMLQVFHLWPATQQASIGKCRARWSGLPVTEESFRGHAATEVIQLTTDFICIYYVRIIYKPITKNWFMTVYATTTCVHIHNNMYNLQLLAMILILHVDIFSWHMQSTMVWSAELLFLGVFTWGLRQNRRQRMRINDCKSWTICWRRLWEKSCSRFSSNMSPILPGQNGDGSKLFKN